MMHVREALPDDAKTVLADLSEITRADIAAHGMDDGAVYTEIERYFREGAVHVLEENGRPLVVGGVAVTNGMWICWLLASEGFWSVRPSIWRNLRRYSQIVLAGLNEELHSYSASPHPALSRWMAALGFEEVETDGKFRHFIYPR